MIQSSSLSPLSALPAAGDQPLPLPGEGPQTADFGALLALSEGQTAEADVPGEAPQLPAVPGISPATLTAITGKILPPALPEQVPVSEAEKPAVTPLPADVLPRLSLRQGKPELPVQRRPAKSEVKPETTPVPGDPAPVVEVPTLPLVTLQPASVQPGSPLPAQPPVLPVASEPAEQPTMPATPASRMPDPAARAMAHAAPQAAFLRAVRPGQDPVAQPAGPAMPPGQPPQAAPVLPPVNQVRIELAPTPPVPVMRAPAKDELRPAALTAQAEPALPLLAAPTAPGTGSALPAPPVQPQLQADRPQDFSALIDRLVAAREAAGPQAISVSLAHSDFGRINLRFRHDEAGLAVSLASPDPAFARAASALPPVLPVADSQAAQFQSGQSGPRQDGAAASGQSGHGQQRGAQSDRGESNQPQANHQPRQSRPGKPQHRSGIFA